jgi:trehalose-phosphatase
MPRAAGRVPIPLDSARRQLRARVGKALSLFLALDYDGTLVPIAERPELARPTQETLDALAKLARAPNVCVVVLSGRGLEDLRNMLPIQELALAGLHGLETWPPIRVNPQRVDVHRVRADLDRLLLALKDRLGSAPSPRIEDKRHAIAFHFRGFPRAEGRRMRTAVQAAFRALENSSLVLVPGKEVLEARPSGVNKGSCARSMQERMRPGSLAVVMGDDVTDEDLFRAFERDGITIAVGRAPKTRARYSLKGPAEVIAFLRDIEAARREPPAA